MCFELFVICFRMVMVTHHRGDSGLGSSVEPRYVELCELIDVEV